MLSSSYLLVCFGLAAGASQALEAACSSGSGVCTKFPPAKDSVLLQVDHAPRVQMGVNLGDGTQAPALLESNSSGAEWLQREDMELLQGSPSAEEMDHFRLVRALRARGWTCPNGQRFAPNRDTLEWDCRLWRAARSWAQRMARESFWHHRRGESTPCKRTEDQGFPRLRGCGSAIVRGKQTPAAALEDLKSSLDHCHIFMDPVYNKMGVGYGWSASSDYKHYWSDALGGWHQGPDRSCIGGSPAPTPAPGCADIDTVNCGYYKSQGLCQKSANVQEHCKDTCGIGSCGQSSPSPSPQPAPSTCEDTDGACSYYKSAGYCQTSENVKTHCKNTCGLCSGSCADMDGNCAYYRDQGYCSSENVKKHCKRTCGLC